MPGEKAFLTSTGILPPFPSSSVNSVSVESNGLVEDDTAFSNNGSCDSSLPKRLLSLIRTLDKERNDEDSEATDRRQDEEDEAVDLLNHLIAVYSRRGLLQGNVSTAERTLSASPSTSQNTGGGRRGSKKGSKNNSGKQNSANELGIHDGSTASLQQQQPDEALIFTAILRILPSSSAAIPNTKLDDDQVFLISLASELCVAIAQHIIQQQSSSPPSTCALAEYELLAQHGKAILTGLLIAMQTVLVDALSNRGGAKYAAADSCCLTLLQDLDPVCHIQTLDSTIKAACCLICLFGTKLSRSTSLIHDLQTVALRLLTVSEDSVQESAAKLLACLPLAGGTDRTTPSDLWNSQLAVVLSTISTTLSTMAPLTKQNSSNDKDRRLSVSDNLLYNVALTNKMLEDWAQFVRRKVSDGPSRLQCFYRFTRGLKIAICSLLLQDYPNSVAAIAGAQVNAPKLLEVVESFVSFALYAESMFYKTKRRLRDELVDDGLLSPRAIAVEVSNHIKRLGHEILDSVLAAMGGPVLLPYARRIIRISYASILTSSSGSVRKVMGPTSVAQLEGKKRRWLHLSVPMRTQAVQTFERCISGFGSDNSESVSKTLPVQNALASTDGEKAISLVVGSLLEQIGSDNVQMDNFDEDWGTEEERLELVVSCCRCLSATLLSCAGFLPMSIRTLVESVAVSALSLMNGTRSATESILIWASVKVSVLDLASTCVTVPWQDGSSSSIVEELTTVAKQLAGEADVSVSISAKSALRICDAIGAQRAPAFLYVSRASSENFSTATAELLVDSIKMSQQETILARKKDMEAEVERKAKRDRKRNLEEQKRLEQAAKRQKGKAPEWTSVEMEAPPTTNDVSEAAKDPERDAGSKVVPEEHNDPETMVDNSKSGKENETERNLIDRPKAPEPNSENGKKNKNTSSSPAVDDQENDVEEDDEDLPEIFAAGPDSDEED